MTGYIHKRTNKRYWLIEYALLKQDGQWIECAIYKNIVGNTFVRTKDDFLQKFKPE